MTSVVATLCQGESRCIPCRDTKRGNLPHQIPDPGALRDSGVSVPDMMPLLDLAGNPREVGDAVDLGAIEFPQ
jgi:hypothetical protein